MSHTSETKEYLRSLYNEDEILESKMQRLKEEMLYETKCACEVVAMAQLYDTMALRRKELSKLIDEEQEYYESLWIAQN